MKFKLTESNRRKYLREERVKPTTEEEYNRHPVVQTAQKMCESHGYDLLDIYWDGKFNGPVIHVRVPYESNLPEISLSLGHRLDSDKESKFMIQTTSVGALDISKYQEFLHDMNEGLSLAKELTTLLPTLEKFGPEID